MVSDSWLRHKIVSLFVFVSLFLNLVVPAPARVLSYAEPVESQDPIDKIEPALLADFTASQELDFFVWMKEKADLSKARTMQDKDQKGQYVYETLRETARRTQAELLSQLDREGKTYQSFYIANKVLVRGGSRSAVLGLANRSDVGRITANHAYQLEEPKKAEGGGSVTALAGNISYIHADDVWAAGVTGEGIVLAGNDTGLDWEHPAIQSHYRGWDGTTANHNYQWWDATGDGNLEPVDPYGHGTHTTGIMVGDTGAGTQIGVAPGAKTIHCRNMDSSGSGDDVNFTTCFEWDLAPWDLSGDRDTARPDLAPDVVNNSWGYWGGYTVFREEIEALQAAGIVVEVSAGNAGEGGCGTLGSPGDYEAVLTTGSVDWNDQPMPGVLSYFSSRGPSSLDGGFSPDIMAPGDYIVSAVPGGGYDSWSGTSMAGPHVSGLVGLLWSANPGLRGMVEDTAYIIKSTAVPLAGQLGASCGGDYVDGPNNDWGMGTIDANAAYTLAMTYGNPSFLEGKVTDESGAPIENALVKATDGEKTFKGVTDADGMVRIRVWEGTYTVTAWKWGYVLATEENVLFSGEDVTLDFALAEARRFTLTGKLYDLTAGWPLYGRIRARVGDITPLPPDDQDFSQPTTGEYSLSVVEGADYTLSVEAQVPGYLPATIQTGPITGDLTLDIGLEADLTTCEARGWMLSSSFVENFDSGALPDGWSVVDHAENGEGWRFDNPFVRENLTGGVGLFATADLGDGAIDRMDSSLVTPALDLTDLNQPVLSFHTYIQGYFVSTFIEASTDGVNWSGVWAAPDYPAPDGGRPQDRAAGPAARPAAQQALWAAATDLGPFYRAAVDLSAFAGEPAVQLRFHFIDEYSGLWQIDDLAMGECQPQEGSFVTGFVTGPRGEGILYATVASAINPKGGTITLATPEDPELGDGLYILFTSLESPQEIVASMPPAFETARASVTILTDRNARQDFTLRAADFSAEPPEVQVNVQFGTRASTTLLIQNKGTLDGTYQIQELESGPPNEELYWDLLAPLPENLMGNAAVTLNEKVYSLTGGPALEFGGTRAAYRYDPVTNAWTEIARPVYARQYASAAAIGGKIYLVNGVDDPAHLVYNVLEIYDPATNAWSFGPTFPHGLRGSGVAVYQDEMYVVGGVDSNRVFKYNPETEVWSELASLPKNLGYPACATVLGEIYCAGGLDGMQALRTLYVYDPQTNAWTQGPDSPYHLYGASAIASRGKLYLYGGWNGEVLLYGIRVYNALTHRWLNTDWYPYIDAAFAGGACGFYKVGGYGFFYEPGSTDEYAALNDVERLPQLDRCPGEDLRWLDVRPNRGEIGSGESETITLDFDAAAPEVTQPGEYKAELFVQNSGAYGDLTIPVTMNVTPPSSWGNIDGTVYGLGNCDTPGSALAGATVEIWDGETLVGTVQTSWDGLFHWAMDEGEYQLKISSVGYLTRTFNVTIPRGGTLNRSFDLHLEAGCLSVSPASIQAQVVAGEATSQQMEIRNRGGREMAFTISESTDVGGPVAGTPWAGTNRAPAPVGPLSLRWNRPEATTPGESARGEEKPAPLSLSDWYEGKGEYNASARYGFAQCAEEPNVFFTLGGVSQYGDASRYMMRFDADGNEWTGFYLNDIPAAEGPAAVCYDSKIYLMGGSGMDQFLVYDIRLDRWTRLPPLPRGVWGAAAAAWNGKIYLIGGSSTFEYDSTSSRVDIYDPAERTWTRGAPMPYAAVAAGSTQAGPYVYVVGGFGADETDIIPYIQRYDLRRNVWELGPGLPVPRYDFALAATDKALYAIGGMGITWWDSRHVDRFALDSWPEGDWTVLPEVPEPVWGNSAGFCTSVDHDAEIWSTFGWAPSEEGRSVWHENRYYPIQGESCVSTAANLPWLSVEPESGTVPPGGVMAGTVILNAAGLTAGTYEGSILVKSDDGNSSYGRVPVTLEVLPRINAVSVDPELATQFAEPGQKATYTLTVKNEGNGTETFKMDISGGSWIAEGPAQVGPLAPGAEATVTLLVSVPGAAPVGASNTIMVKFASQSDPTRYTVAALTTVSLVQELRIETGDNALSALPGQQAVYHLTIHNEGGRAVTAAIGLSGHTWLSSPSTTEVGPIPAGGSADLTVTVSVPQNAAPNAQDALTLSVREGGAAAASDQITLTTTAGSQRGLSLDKNHVVLVGKTGQQVSFRVKVTNTGNSADGYRVTGDAALAPRAEPACEAMEVPPGQSCEFTVTVTVPETLDGMAVYELRVESVNDEAVGAPVELILYVTRHSLYLPLYPN